MSKAKKVAETAARQWLEGGYTEEEATSFIASILGASMMFAEKLLMDAAERLTRPLNFGEDNA